MDVEVTKKYNAVVVLRENGEGKIYKKNVFITVYSYIYHFPYCLIAD